MTVALTPPYAGLTYSEHVVPPGIQTRPPRIDLTRGRLEIPGLSSANPGPSAGHQIGSIAVEVGAPRDDRGRPFDWPELLMDVHIGFVLDPGLNVQRRREFNSAFVDGRVAAFVDNDRGEGFEAGAAVLVHDEGFAFWDSDTLLPPRIRPGVSTFVAAAILVPARARYRVFADLRADFRAAGFGGGMIGGSSATIALVVIITRISCRWSLPPL